MVSLLDVEVSSTKHDGLMYYTIGQTPAIRIGGGGTSLKNRGFLLSAKI